jgi:hypothetical protein
MNRANGMTDVNEPRRTPVLIVTDVLGFCVTEQPIAASAPAAQSPAGINRARRAAECDEIDDLGVSNDNVVAAATDQREQGWQHRSGQLCHGVAS